MIGNGCWDGGGDCVWDGIPVVVVRFWYDFGSWWQTYSVPHTYHAPRTHSKSTKREYRVWVVFGVVGEGQREEEEKEEETRRREVPREGVWWW